MSLLLYCIDSNPCIWMLHPDFVSATNTNNWKMVLIQSNLNQSMVRWIYNYLCNQCLSPLTLWVRTLLRRGVLDTTLCDKVRQWLAISWWFSLGTPVSSTNETDRHYITEILCYRQYLPYVAQSVPIFQNLSWKRLERRLFQLFSDNLAVVLNFLILHDKRNIRTLSLKLFA
jgi:hypothetical protein